MGEQYFERRPRSTHRLGRFEVTIRGHPFTFQTDAGVFSGRGLDRGTELLLAALEVGPCESILDLGCGYGTLGIVAARLSEGGRVILTDVNERAVALAKANVAANGIRNAEVRTGALYQPVADLAFDHILANPPIRAGREIVDRIIAAAPARLLEGGSLWLVAPTPPGAESMRAPIGRAFPDATEGTPGKGLQVPPTQKSCA